MKKSARFSFLFLLFSFFSCFFAVTTASAQANQVNSYAVPNNNPDVPKNLHTWTQNILIDVASALTCQISGIDPVDPNQECLGVDQQTGKIGFVKNGGGAIGVMGNMISMLYTPPIHTKDYFNYLAGNFGVVKPAQAADPGLGFKRISPLINIWSMFRNIVYLLFVVAFIVIGIAIMLRIKIDPRTVMSIENQIPKIIIGLLLVTFSFAIAGLLIDLMYVSIYIIINLFSDNNLIKNKELLMNAQSNFSNDNVFSVFNGAVRFTDIVGSTAGGIKDIVRDLFSNPDYVVPQRDWWQFWGGIQDLLNSLRNGFAFLFGGIAGVLALLIISVAILFSLFRLWFELLKSYVFILLDIVIAPFLIITGVFPGGVGVGGWLRDLVANLLSFPLTIGMFLLGRAFMDAFSTNEPVFVAPLIGNPGNPQAIGNLIALGIILLTPQVVTMMKDALKAPEFKYFSAVGQALGAGADSGKNILSTAGVGAFGTAKPGERGFPAVARKIFGI